MRHAPKRLRGFREDSQKEETCRFAVELAPAADGRVEGSLRCDRVEGVVRFSGWLMLLRLREVHALPRARGRRAGTLETS